MYLGLLFKSTKFSSILVWSKKLCLFYWTLSCYTRVAAWRRQLLALARLCNKYYLLVWLARRVHSETFNAPPSPKAQFTYLVHTHEIHSFSRKILKKSSPRIKRCFVVLLLPRSYFSSIIRAIKICNNLMRNSFHSHIQDLSVLIMNYITQIGLSNSLSNLFILMTQVA